MKLLKLTFQNINSLYGKWTIDFENPAYTENGLFVLSGPTGSGKTSILDAICLALFGTTPRIEQISDKKNKKSVVFSKGADVCSAQLLFETDGKRYIASWAQEVNRNGNLNPARHQVSDGDGNLLESAASKTDKYIADLIKLDYSQFTRTVMLTQGNFDRFLASSSKEKSALFTEITGSQIYDEISSEAYDRKKAKEDKWKDITERISEVSLLTEDERSELEKSVCSFESRREELGKKRDQIKESLNWHAEIGKLREIGVGITEKEDQLRERTESFKVQEIKLEAAERAAEIEGVHDKLCTQEGILIVKRDRLETTSEQLIEKEKELKSAEELLDKAREDLAKREEEDEKARPVILKVRMADRELSNLEENRKEAEKEYDGRVQKFREAEMGVTEKEGALSLKNEELRRQEEYLKDHSDDGKLIVAYDGIRELLRDLAEQKKLQEGAESSVAEAEKDLENIKKAAENKVRQIDNQRKIFDKANQSLNELEEEKEKLLKGLTIQELERARDEQAGKVAAFKAVADFEEQRRQLQDGSPCPLCGAVHHPYALGNVPSGNEEQTKLDEMDERLQTVRRLFEKIEKAKKTVSDEQNGLRNAQGDLRNINGDIKHKEQIREERGQRRDEIADRVRTMENGLVGKLESFGVFQADLADAEAVLKRLAERKEKWQSHSEARDETKKAIGTLETEAAVLKNTMAEAEKERDKAKRILGDDESKLAEKKRERAELFGDKDPDEVEKQVRDAVTVADKKVKDLAESKNDAEKQRDQCRRDITRLEGEIKEENATLRELTDSFNEAIQQKGFQNRDDFKGACLKPEVRGRIREQKQQLENERTRLKTERELNEKALQEKIGMHKTDKSVEELEIERDETERELRKNEEELTDKKSQLSLDDRNREKTEQLQGEMETAKKEYQKWKRLWDVIGPNKNSFSNYVQTLTFDRVVQYANEWLEKMVPRYRLKRREEEPEKNTDDRKKKKVKDESVTSDTDSKETETSSGESRVNLNLDVIDFEQGGDVRVVENLSGGERFMVSLALALGISRLAGKNVQIDTFFLDEGFGTLDENALENAIDVLEQLQREGKTIGIVTHVEKLRGEESRIQTQIQAEKIGGGRSILNGPGVTRGAEEREPSAKPKKRGKK